MDINEILSSLSADDIEKLKQTAQSIIGNDSRQNSAAADVLKNLNGGDNSTGQGQSEKQGNSAGGAAKNAPNPTDMLNVLGQGLNIDQSLLTTMAKINGVISGDDERTTLLKALKPMLSEDKREKADEAIKLIKLMELAEYLKNSGIGGSIK